MIALDARRTALLLIDLQEEQRSDPDYAAHDFPNVLNKAASLLEAARNGGRSVAHARYVRDFSVVPPRPFEDRKVDGSAAFSDAGSGATDICAEVGPLRSEPVIVKNDASAFKGTGLDTWLSQNGIEWIVIGGVWTEACVAATVRDATALGYRVLIVKDACGSGSGLMHQTAILNLANRLYGGAICDTVRAISLLSGHRAEVWRVSDPVPMRFTEETVESLYQSL